MAVRLRRQAAMRHHSSSSGSETVAELWGKSSPERMWKINNDGYPEFTLSGDVDGTLSALDSRVSVNVEGLGGQQVISAQLSAEQEPKQSCEDLMEVLCSPAGGIATALRSIASWDRLSQGPHIPLLVPHPFSCGALEGGPDETKADGEPSNQISPLTEELEEHGDKEETKGECENETPVMTQSKYIHILPLYQDYCLQCVRTELRRKQNMVSCLSLSGLLSPLLAAPECQPLQPRSFIESPSSLWQDLPEVQKSGVLHTLTPREKCLQEAMFEMIGSEASYLKSLMVVINHFLGSRELSLTLPKMEHHILFSNLDQVKRVSERFLLSLESRFAESVVMSQVGDLVLHHRAALRGAYIPYITNMMYQETLIRRLLQGNREFVEVLRKLEGDPVCQRQNLKSFLVLPFQRITRLRILLENILKLTPSDTEAVVSLKGSIAAIHQIVIECDHGVQRLKQTEELVHLDKLVDFGSVKSIPLISRGRHLLHEGSLHQVIVEGSPHGKSMISLEDIYLHLFNNLLLLSLREVGCFSVLDYSVFPAHVEVGQLKTELLGLPAESFLLRLSQNHAGVPIAFILAADTSSDRETWIKALSSETDEGNTQHH